MSNAKKKVLLIEPNYANKFPPVGLMKIATYYRNRGTLYGDDWDIVFYKGDLKKFVIERITDNLIEKLNDADGTNTIGISTKIFCLSTSALAILNCLIRCL